MDEESLLLEMYRIQIARSEHYERIRASLSSLLLVVTAAIVGLWTASEGVYAIPMQKWFLPVMLILTGVFGFVASRMHSKRSHRHGKCAEAMRLTLYPVYPRFEKAYESIKREDTNLNKLWDVLHMCVVFLGAVLFATIAAA